MAYDDQVKTETVPGRFEPEQVSRFWQHNATRLMRANERILNGIWTAASREMQLVQELTRYNLDKFQKLSDRASPGQDRIEPEQQIREFEHILSGLREVSEDLWKTFGDASKLLLDGALTEAKEVTVDALHQGARQAESVVEQASEPFKKQYGEQNPQE